MKEGPAVWSVKSKASMRSAACCTAVGSDTRTGAGGVGGGGERFFGGGGKIFGGGGEMAGGGGECRENELSGSLVSEFKG